MVKNSPNGRAFLPFWCAKSNPTHYFYSKINESSSFLRRFRNFESSFRLLCTISLPGARIFRNLQICLACLTHSIHVLEPFDYSIDRFDSKKFGRFCIPIYFYPNDTYKFWSIGGQKRVRLEGPAQAHSSCLIWDWDHSAPAMLRLAWCENFSNVVDRSEPARTLIVSKFYERINDGTKFCRQFSKFVVPK